MAATVGKINGTDFLLYIGGIAIIHSTSCSVNLTMGTINVSTKGSKGWTDKLASVRDWNGSADACVCLDETIATLPNIGRIYGAINARTAVTIKFATANADDRFLSGSAFITGMNPTAGQEAPTTFSLSFEGTGKLKFAKT